MAATRGERPIATDETAVGDDAVTIAEHDADRARCELVVERGGERWRVRVHYDGAIEVVDARRASAPVWVARVIRRYEFQTREN